MPIHLTRSTTRREFLRDALGTATVVSASRLSAETGSSSWVFLADTHIDADPATTVRGVNMTDSLRSVSTEILAEANSAEAVFINGDCAYLKGLADDYAQLRSLVEPLRQGGLDLHMTLGNHDDFGNFRQSFPQPEASSASDPVPGRHLTVIHTPLVNWFLLDSLFQVNVVTGHFGEAQLRWLDSVLDHFPDQPAILLGHHNPQLGPTSVRDGKPYFTGLSDTAAFYELLHRKPQVQAFVYGHTHRWNISRTAQGVHLVNLPPVAYVFDDARPNGWVHATVNPLALNLQLHCQDPALPAHGQKVQLPWR